MGEPRNHHYVSRFYLKGFGFNCDIKDDTKYACFFYHVTNDSKINQASIKDIASQKDLFTLTLPSGEKDFSLEKDFSNEEFEIASHLNFAIEKIKNGAIPSNDEQLKILDLILFQLKRSTIVNSQYIEKSEKIKEKIKLDIDGKEPNHTLKIEDFDREMKNAAINLLKQGIFEQEFNKYNIKDLLLTRNWYFIKITDSNKSFVTSDMPLYRYNDPLEPDGFANPNTQIIFPLSAKILLVIYGDGGNRRIKVINNNEFIKKANGMIISNATNFVIGNNQKLIEKMKERKNGRTKKYGYPQNVLFLNNED